MLPFLIFLALIPFMILYAAVCVGARDEIAIIDALGGTMR